MAETFSGNDFTLLCHMVPYYDKRPKYVELIHHIDGL